jgi:RHS repeat-associated protein
MKKKIIVALAITAFVCDALAYYNPEQGRWTTRDPIYEQGSIASQSETTERVRLPMNIYAFCANNPVFYYDKNGLAYFALRPLGGKPWIPIGSHNPLDDWLNTEISHEQVFFEDQNGPGNIGFFNDNTVREDDPALLSGYRKIKTGYNDCVMRIAVAQTKTKPYSLLGIGSPKKFNCQDFAEAVRKKYSELVRDITIRAKCCVKKSEIK